MAFIIVAVLAGTVIGLLAGGSPKNLGNASFRLWPLLLAGLVTQGSAGLGGERWAVPLVLASYVLLLAFAGANVRLVGMALVFVGVAMNSVTIAANGGMPVRGEAIVAAGIADWDELHRIDFGTKRHLAGPEDRLMVLSDIIPVPVAKEVLSFGDLVMSVGVADVLVHLLRPPRRRVQQLVPG